MELGRYPRSDGRHGELSFDVRFSTSGLRIARRGPKSTSCASCVDRPSAATHRAPDVGFDFSAPQPARRAFSCETRSEWREECG
jgi:hypothetical protein